MCGIFAAVSTSSVTPILVDALNALSYRGYDSSGIVIADNTGLKRRRCKGKIKALCSLLKEAPLDGYTGIAHTRWATHGAPSKENAHPHMTAQVAVVHNGIIENYPQLKKALEKKGYEFESNTDTETIPKLITSFLDEGFLPEQALRKTCQQLEGRFAIAVVFAATPDVVYATRLGSPLVIGQGHRGHFVSSDHIALSRVARNLCHLEDAEIAKITFNKIEISNKEGRVHSRKMKPLQISPQDQSKQGYKHYMLKEIHQQPEVMRATLEYYCNTKDFHFNEARFPQNIEGFSRLSIVACGTSYYAAMIARHWFEKYAGIPVEVDIASEYRYRGSPLSSSTLSLSISQSGETADTLAALQYSKKQGLTCLSLLNVESSRLAEESDAFLRTLAGPEIGVASTKAFTGQLMVLLLTALYMGQKTGQIKEEETVKSLKALKALPEEMAKIIDKLASIESIAKSLAQKEHLLYLGRGVAYPLALEGALKLKEISYIHAEAYPAGELKHGPIALIDENMPLVLIAPPGELVTKTLSNLREVAARGAKVILISNREGIEMAEDHICHSIEMPDCDPLLQALLYTLPLQLLAYHVACIKGCDVDQPRNLAKSVTVE